MKLHELVNLRNSLQTAIDLASIEAAIEENKKKLNIIASTADPEYHQSIDNIVDYFNRIKTQLPKTIDDINSLIQQVQDRIVESSQKFFANNYQLELSFKDDDMLPENIRNYRHWRRIRMDIADSPDMHLLSRIYQFCTYKYPALEIGCRDGEFTKFLTASDPLYIADVHQEFLNKALENFPSEYSGRVRKYLVKDNMITGLPKNQFGFIFSYNFFNYLSFDSIKQLMIQAYQWLRPGGTILFTYNNADLGVGAAYAENMYMSYVPRSMLIPLCESIGFDLVDHRDYEPNVSWVEFQKPGTLTTVKSSQSLGEIKYKNC